MLWGEGTVRLHDFRLPSPCKWDLRPCGMLRSLDWWWAADVSGQPVGPMFKD